MHFRRAADLDYLAHGGRLDRRRARYERDLGASPRRLGRDRIAHAPARPVADEPHGIEILEGRPGRDE